MEQDYQNRIKLVPKFQEGTGNWLTRLFSNKQREIKKAYDTAESNYLAQNLAARFKDNNLNKDWMSTDEDGKIHVDKTKYNVWANSDEGKFYIKDFQETDEFKKYRSTWDNYYKQNEQEGLEGIRRFGTDFVDYVNNAVYHDPTEQVAQTNQVPNPYREEFRNRINTTFSIPSFSTSPIYTPVSFNPQLTVPNPQTVQQETYTPKYSNLNYNQIANWYNNSQRLADLNSFMLQNDSNWQDINSYSDITPEIIDRIYDYQGTKGVSQDGKVGDRTMGRRQLVKKPLIYINFNDPEYGTPKLKPKPQSSQPPKITSFSQLILPNFVRANIRQGYSTVELPTTWYNAKVKGDKYYIDKQGNAFYYMNKGNNKGIYYVSTDGKNWNVVAQYIGSRGARVGNSTSNLSNNPTARNRSLAGTY